MSDSAMSVLWEKQCLTPEDQAAISKAFPVYKEHGMAYFGATKYLSVCDSAKFFEQYHATPVTEGDVWVVTLPKCGTTWSQEMVWLIANDLDYEGAKSLLMPDRWHFLEIEGITDVSVRDAVRNDDNPIAKEIFFRKIDTRPHPWFVKTHLPLYMCPVNLLEQAKVIYVARNPKDMCVSYYYHMQLYDESDPDLTFEEFAQLFIQGHVSQLPYFAHLLEAWRNRHNKNCYFLFYEEMKHDLPSVIRKISQFLGKSFTDDQINQLTTHLSFDSMKKNKWVNWEWLSTSSWSKDDESLKFMRKGVVGDCKNHFTPELDKQFDRWIEENLKDTDFRFYSAS